MIHECVEINDIEIDKSIATLITKLWLKGVRTYQSCGGGEFDLSTCGFKDAADFVANGNTAFSGPAKGCSVSAPSDAYYIHDGKVYEKAYIITHMQDLHIVLKYLAGKDPFIELQSSGGYVLSEYCENPCEEKDAAFIMFKNL